MTMTTCYFNDCNNAALSDSSKCEFHKHRLKCLIDGCHNQVYARRLCVRHGGKKLCAFPDCNRNARLGKFCSLHGVVTHKRHCNEDGCLKMAHARGKCVRHGGGRRCAHPECPSHARHKGYCSRHAILMMPLTPPHQLEAKMDMTISPAARWPGGNGFVAFRLGSTKKQCTFPDCTRRAHARRMCVRHGGGRKCSVEECTSHARSGGLCCRHGRGRLSPPSKCSVAWGSPEVGTFEIAMTELDTAILNSLVQDDDDTDDEFSLLDPTWLFTETIDMELVDFGF
ncbi:hypothetical protein SPRG_12767 [Saprolegnia parasitica CBS 223.65]|uniref:Uncharacterized protein n=1 Tax=Saprolegnia parasitica (strain CBS 223.65) TaxID=695850 RepID=A0A067C048_SAPPC|nr:hypothetical protein SPRG_12767 [Saprolegnia parasitica CBS 223.65]KDO22485.1 hypothetical protein SPRG_12767 [Saprolegnia parasitica CBS 223.65]|eukprot:XP_012206870.1 hypothetical protein SPRG_12767 [Saprolegnia parasitica CBS 223.65]